MLLLALAAQLVLSDIRVIDGDTIAADGVKYRIIDLDAPETGARARCPAERALGELAKARAQQLIGGAHQVTVDTEGAKDRYGRTLGSLAIDGVDFSATMITEGLARPWKPPSRWCAQR